jgi:hypothetical protein
MSISIKIDGMDKYLAALVNASDLMRRELCKQLKAELEDIKRQARYEHRFTSRSGNLEEAIQYKVDPSGLSGVIWLEKEGNDTPYAFRIHEGFVNKTDSLGRTFNGPKPDRFLYEAAETKYDQLIENMSDAVERGIEMAGL